MVMEHLPSSSDCFYHLLTFRDSLQKRYEILASLEQSGTPEVMKVLCLLLREIWETRIWGGASKLVEQPTSALLNLCKLIQNGMEDWERLKEYDTWWCGHFCGRIWFLRESRGREPGCWKYDKALEDLRVIKAEAQRIISARPATEADPRSSGGAEAVTSVDDSFRVKEELQVPQPLRTVEYQFQIQGDPENVPKLNNYFKVTIWQPFWFFLFCLLAVVWVEGWKQLRHNVRSKVLHCPKTSVYTSMTWTSATRFAKMGLKATATFLRWTNVRSLDLCLGSLGLPSSPRSW